MDNRSKVRIFNKNTETDTLDTAKAQILADPKLQEKCNACISLYKSFISQPMSMRKNAINISSITITTNKRKLDMVMEDRYYSKEEYNTLKSTQKNQLWKIFKNNPNHHATKKGKKDKDSAQ
eukprot:15360787-Ditylum_brightwellii.AAC.1